jgi:mono/diheme cytochrome c family protein
MRQPVILSSLFTALPLLAITAVLFGAQSHSEDDPDHRNAEIDRGRYLVQIAGCNDCHTPEYALQRGAVDEANWLTGSRVGFEGPWGTTYPSNLRLLANELTSEEWLIHARLPMRPPMPWFSLRDMTDQDLTAVYRFIRTLGPAGARAPAYEPPKQTAHVDVVRRWHAE